MNNLNSYLIYKVFHIMIVINNFNICLFVFVNTEMYAMYLIEVYLLKELI